MNFVKNPKFLGAAIALYFSVAWFFPWGGFDFEASISDSYLWDILFVVLISALYKLVPRLGNFSGIIPRSIATLSLAAVSILFIRATNFPAPFKYLERPVLQLLVLAPVVEELLFRHAILGASLKAMKSKNMAMLLGAVIFSISHLPAAWHLPPEFRHFVVAQVLYTFFLGWVLSKSRARTGGVVEPIFLHFLFNLCFYVSIVMGWI